ncbi:MAG: IS21 family transposase [Actinomycetota bacterium]|nr:IS21 family transposase [Actinomycetota bacterium]
MLGVVDKEVIRRLHYRQGWSVRRIARELGHDRATVHKYLQEGSDPPRYRLAKPRRKPVLDPVLPIIAQWLADDEQQPPKQRRTAHRMWLQLREEYGFTGGEPTIRYAVRHLKAHQRPVFIPLQFAPGERAEVDWGTAQVVLLGKITTVQLFCARLRYSGMPFVIAFPHQQQEAFFAGHRRAFEFWGGVPATVVYDNLTTAVRTVLVGHTREEQDGFVSLRMHYCYEAIFCNPAAGHEKGAVENLVGTIRRRYLSPMPQVRDLDELNAYLLACCQREGEATRPGADASVAVRWQEEQSALLALPAQPFDCSRRVAVKATRTAEVTFATNRCSVPAAYAHQPLTLKADVWTVRLYKEATLVAEHPRCYGQHQRMSDWRHYLPVLARKPGAVPFAAALRNGDLPPAFEQFRQGLCSHLPDGDRAFVRVLELALLHPLSLVTQAVEQALACRAFQVEAVTQLLDQALAPRSVPPPLDPARHPSLAVMAVTLPPVSLTGYDQLQRGGVA